MPKLKRTWPLGGVNPSPSLASGNFWAGGLDPTSLNDRISPVIDANGALISTHGGAGSTTHLADMPDNGSFTVTAMAFLGMTISSPVKNSISTDMPATVAITYDATARTLLWDFIDPTPVAVIGVETRTYLLGSFLGEYALRVRLGPLFDFTTNHTAVIHVAHWGGAVTDHDARYLNVEDIADILGQKGILFQFFADAADVYAVLHRGAAGLLPAVVQKGHLNGGGAPYTQANSCVDNETIIVNASGPYAGQLSLAPDSRALAGLSLANRLSLPSGGGETQILFNTSALSTTSFGAFPGFSVDAISGIITALRKMRVRVTAVLNFNSYVDASWSLGDYAAMRLCKNGSLAPAGFLATVPIVGAAGSGAGAAQPSLFGQTYVEVDANDFLTIQAKISSATATAQVGGNGNANYFFVEECTN